MEIKPKLQKNRLTTQFNFRNLYSLRQQNTTECIINCLASSCDIITLWCTGVLPRTKNNKTPYNTDNKVHLFPAEQEGRHHSKT